MRVVALAKFVLKHKYDCQEKKLFLLFRKRNGQKSFITSYSGFVPKRTDYYTWENDRVAFRIYGFGAMHMVEKILLTAL